MFTDWTEALEAEALPLDLNPAQQLAAAARVTARSSRDKDDMALLLDVLGLPTDTDTLTALLPLIPETGDAPTMTNTPAAPALSAFEAMAISMHNNGDSEQAIREATGLSETELSDLIANHVLGLPRAAADAPTTDVPVVALPVSNALQELIDWATAHPTASVRSRAARITSDLSELSERRDSEAAQREAEAEAKVAKARAELEKAQEELRTVKAGTRTTTAAATAPTPIRAGLGSGRTREELAAVRTWARANDHQVADAGMVPKRVLKAYDAAHQAPVRKAG
ncbi:Lsr2 family protein [Streptomyces durbertensis]|uniref:Lsr2 family protein n=1 Tax=Streptomyces durbertensis TaxID=2448886 RepID=A0ABR6EI06_9ACTN|nr:histone-like nucleoid-structuring protein Lsr2 [Streptomyces durbertensis]MBB1244798.1 Lsr2 family protein [Streptomyces durbertensis]